MLSLCDETAKEDTEALDAFTNVDQIV
jgi:hypothetical protein